MSAITATVSPQEKITWWNSCMGQCTICGAPFQYPLAENLTALSVRTDMDTLLFKYGLLNVIESGHLIDKYILDNIRALKTEHFTDSQLKVAGKWPTRTAKKLERLVAQANNNTVPVCKACNAAMTKTNTDVTSLFYGFLDPKWFQSGHIPFHLINKSASKLSLAKALEAMFVFFTLRHKDITEGAGPINPAVDTDVLGDGEGPDDGLERDRDDKEPEEEEEEQEAEGEEEGPYDQDDINHQPQLGEFYVSKNGGAKQHKVQKVALDPKGNHVKVHLQGVRSDLSLRELTRDYNFVGGNEPRSPTLSQGESSPGASSEPRGRNSPLAHTSANNTGRNSSGEAKTPEVYEWVLKEKADVWRDFCVLKVVSHLMQWGATRVSRQRALAIFWAGFYIWISFLNVQQQSALDFKIWYIFVFRQYYRHIFVGNTWFSHDVLTIGQLTNVNKAMFTETYEADAALTAAWHTWTRKQMDTVGKDLMGVCKFVFSDGEDKSGMRSARLEQIIPTKDKIVGMIDTIRENAGGAQGLFTMLYRSSATPNTSIDLYFKWYMFIMSSTRGVTDVYMRFKTAVNSSLQKQKKKDVTGYEDLNSQMSLVFL